MSSYALGYIYQLKLSGKTSVFYYLTLWNAHHGKGIKGNNRGMSGWFHQFLYCYGCPQYIITFNDNPHMPVQSPLAGEQLAKAELALEKCKGLGDGAILLEHEKLVELGFSLPYNPPGSRQEISPKTGHPQDIGFHTLFYCIFSCSHYLQVMHYAFKFMHFHSLINCINISLTFSWVSYRNGIHQEPHKIR